MASNNTMLSLLIIFVLATNTMATRNMPADSDAATKDKKLHPEWFHFDGSVLVPGIGRYMIPKDVHNTNPFTYNPITGTNTGNGVTLPGAGGSTGGQSYVPGGDDTLVPNPGVEVPAGGVPAPSTP